MEKLKQCRMDKNYSCQRMANRLNISKTYYWQLEQGKRRLTYDMAIKIANIFETRPDDLFYDEQKNILQKSKK